MIRTITKHWLPLAISTFWVFFATALMVLLHRHVVSALPLGIQPLIMSICYWLIAAVPLYFAFRSKYIPFQKQGILRQLLWGIVIGVATAFLFTVILQPLGYPTGALQPSWPMILRLLYAMAVIALVEEFLFRGFLYHKLRLLFRSEWVAIGVTSVLFGLFHMKDSDPVQVCLAVLMGLIFCLCRKKLRSCTLLSLMVAHGSYLWVMDLWTSVFG